MAQAPPSPLADRITGRVLLPHISWRAHTALLHDIGDGAGRLTYDRGMLEMEIPSRHHEQIERFLGEIVETCLKRAGVDYEPAGNATWRREDQLQGLEADECYHIQHAAAVRDKAELDLSVDPPPDLAIEIELTSPSVNKLGIFTTLGILEIWRIRGDGSCLMLLQAEDGSYRQGDASLSVPVLTPAIVSHYVLLRDQVGHSEAIRRFQLEVLGCP